MDSREGVHQRWRDMEGIKGMLPLRQGWLHPLVRKICKRMEIERIFFFQLANRWSGDSLISNVMHILFAPLSPCACSIYGTHF